MVLNIADALSAYKQSSGSPISADEGVGGDSSGGAVGSFSDTLKSFVGDAVGKLEEGEKAARAGATGKADLASIVIAVGDAEQMLQTVVTIRDKVISAYQDISKTAI